MKITSYEQLNILVAQSLGWVEATHYESQSEPISDVEIEFYHPPDVDKDNAESWFYEYGVAPDFSENWYCVEEWILSECDRLNLLVEHCRTPETISCTIRQINTDNYAYPGVMVYTGVAFKYPKSMCLATCLVWLSFKGIQFQLDLPNETNPETIAS